MSLFDEIQTSIYGAWRLARGDVRGISLFDATYRGFWRSFIAMILIAPLYAVSAGKALLAAMEPDWFDSYLRRVQFEKFAANTIAGGNTARAIEAAASGSIPTSYATRYGSANAKAAAAYGDCLNCNRWY